MTNHKKSLLGTLRAFKTSVAGVAAVEFALLVPIFLTMYLGTLEVSQGLSLNKRVARTASTIADLVTQQAKVSRGDLDAIMDVAETVLFPYTTTNPEIEITAIYFDADFDADEAVIRWSRKLNKDGSNSSGLLKGQKIIMPARLRIDDTFAINVRVNLKYIPLVTWVGQRDNAGNAIGINMSEDYWLYPRITDQIDCSNC